MSLCQGQYQWTRSDGARPTQGSNHQAQSHADAYHVRFFSV